MLVGCWRALGKNAKNKSHLFLDNASAGPLSTPAMWVAAILMSWVAHRKCRQRSRCMIVVRVRHNHHLDLRPGCKAGRLEELTKQ